MNNRLKSTFFWRLYLLPEENTVDPDWLIEELYYLFLDLSEQFTVENTETIHFTFNCGGGYQLEIEFIPELFKHIYLLKNGEKTLLGWWDNAHWHPHFLRIEELELIAEYVKKNDAKWIGLDIPFLFLFGFLCVVDDKTETYVEQKVKRIFNSFNHQLGDMVGKDFHFLYRTHKNYHWHFDAQSDWLVLADEYGAYSLRQKRYEEQKFPFEDWKDMINQIEKALNNNCL